MSASAASCWRTREGVHSAESGIVRSGWQVLRATPVIDTATCSDTVVHTLQRFAETFDARFSSFLQEAKDVPPALATAMQYSALAPGKRFRPFLVDQCCLLAGGDSDAALPAAVAIECVHAFSLIHDDLPAMDDSELRRGRPTNHVRFGEAMAILAGDALLTLAFEILTRPSPHPARDVALTRELALATGHEGMIAGQVADMEGESLPPDLERVEYIHERKTGRLIAAACRMGVIAAGGPPRLVHELGEFGARLGRAFQIADDLLDLTATADRTGKAVRKDHQTGKQTYPAGVGVDGSRAAARAAAESAVAALRHYGEEARSLRGLAAFVVERAF